MEHGLCGVMIRGAYGYSLTLVGWCVRGHGDEWRMLPGHRAVFRTGAVNLNGFDKICANGPQGYRLSDPAELRENLHRLLVMRAKPANEKAWAKECPRPKDWKEEP